MTISTQNEPNKKDELERFKTEINLIEYAIREYGYVVDKGESSRNAVVLRNNTDKISVSLSATSNHWVYWSARNDSDSGSIIDFIQKRKGANLGEVRKLLRPYLSGHTASSPLEKAPLYIPPVKKASADIEKMLSTFHRTTEPFPFHPYLLNERQIPKETLESPLFTNRIRQDRRKNVIFPHYNQNGVCGFVVKNKNFSGFSKNGVRGLWCSKNLASPNGLILFESAIDALSFHALRSRGDEEKLNYISIDGQLSKTQRNLLEMTFEKLSSEAEIFLAFDNDEAGEMFCQEVEEILGKGKWQNKSAVRVTPRGKDWNEDLIQAT